MRGGFDAVTGSQAFAMRALTGWERHWGWPAALSLALLLTAAMVQWQLRPALQHEGAALRAQRAEAERRAAREVRVAPVAPADRLAAMVPEVMRRGHDVGILLDSARESGLTVERADYAVDTLPGGSVTRLHARLPVTGSYAEVRGYVARILNSLPHAALESLQLERQSTQSARLQATLRVVLFYREESP